MQKIMLEHINITASNAYETAKMFEFIFGWKIRWKGAAMLNGFTIHIGDDEQYLAIWAQTEKGGEPIQFEKTKPLNHIGIRVSNLDEIEAKVRAFGIEPFNFQNYAPGRRFYFLDRDAIEYEIISYE